MIIARMTVRHKDFNERCGYIIVTKKEEEFFDKATSLYHVHIDTPLADSAMKAYSESKKEFVCNGSKNELLSFDTFNSYYNYSPYPKSGEKHILYSKEKPFKIFLYKTNCRCYDCYEKYGYQNVMTVRANVKTVRGDFKQINVFYCSKCRKYFISEVQLAQHENTFGTFILSRAYQKGDPDYESSGIYYAPDSVLSRHGYYVSEAKDPGITRRREILWMLIHSGIAHRAQLIELLSSFIKLRSESQYRAKEIWKDDLKYLMSLTPDIIRNDVFLTIAK